LLATQSGRGRQVRDLRKRAVELSSRLDQRGARQRPLSRFAPQPYSFLDQPSVGVVTREQFRLVLSNLGKVFLKSIGDASMKRTSRLA
jgi:hypothetical protein